MEKEKRNKKTKKKKEEDEVEGDKDGEHEDEEEGNWAEVDMRRYDDVYFIMQFLGRSRNEKV